MVPDRSPTHPSRRAGDAALASGQVVFDRRRHPPETGVAMAALNHAAIAGLVALIVYLLIVGQPILLPLVIAGFATYLINALAALSYRIRIGGRTLPATVRFAGAIVIMLLLSWLVVKLLTRNITQVVAAAPLYEQNLQKFITLAADWVGLEEVPQARAYLESVKITNVFRSLAGTLTGLIGSLGAVAIYTVFLLLEQHNFPKKIAALVHDPEREALVHRIFERIGTEIQTYVWLKTLISAATGIACYVVMKTVGLDMAAFWALLIFGLNYIPYIGPWLGVIFPAFLALVQFGTLTPFLVTTGLLALIQFVGGSIIEPRLMGTGLNISPVVMLLALSVWGTVWGIVGMFLAVPLMVVVMIVCSHVKATRGIAVLMSANGELRT
ncbi:MAG TPA: AI-2E family transporter [Vicinamibacterales bacterium]|nr:AI-2E family transporter [Vicinamibacterales bacterium]